MIVSIIGQESLNCLTIPDKANGQYWLYASADAGKQIKIVSIEAINSEWVIRSNRNYSVLDSKGHPLKNPVLKENCSFFLQGTNEDIYCVFAEKVTEDRQTFTKYCMKDQSTIIVGRGEQCDISINNLLVSSHHFELKYAGGKWSIKDLESYNGTFVNDRKTDTADLLIGDVINVIGFKMIIGKDYIAINNPDGSVKINSPALKPYVPQEVIPVDDDEYELDEPAYFYRSPRFKRDIETATFKIDPPPESPLGEEMPWVLVMGSTLAMGAMSAVTLVSAAITGNVTSIVMGASMLIGSVLLPMITKRYEKKQNKKKEAERQTGYREYLNGIAESIRRESIQQSEILLENFIPISECENRILNASRNLWDRSPGQNDFLRLRVGMGEKPLDAEFHYSERKFDLKKDNLQDEMFKLCEAPKKLTNIPITYSIQEDFISAVIGDRATTLEFGKGMIFQIASQYSYDEVKMVFLYDENEADEFEYAKWLPHVWNSDKTFRYIASNLNEAKEISAILEKEVEYRAGLNEQEMEDVMPYYVIFSFSSALALKSEMIKQVLSNKENIRFSLVSFRDELKNVPKESSMIIELAKDSGRLFDKDDISGNSINFRPDIFPDKDARELSVRLANIPLNNLENGHHLPKTYTFLQMFGVGKVEHLNALTRWKESNPTKTLETAIGVDIYGELFKLDLHEKFHGPHGLVAGMTGSGKSELIITYILSLALNYHPYEVAFVLIDYKGGGMAKSFERLPHTVGIITNLDGSAIKRSLVSIEAELKRRQAIFAAVSKKIGVSNIDIYKYQKLYREGTVTEPLQHLFIISDEFAELKTQQPEFMTQLVSAARIGRSLGVHLILATQKPSGVVDDQIWSNSKFRVCLKVQERADSMDMLKRPEAAELTDTGRFYLQVGYNELFELGQSAWSGASYIPSDKVLQEKDDSVAVIDNNGRVLKQVKLNRNKTTGKEKKQLDAITEYLRKTAEDEGIKVRPLWLEPIPGTIMMDELKKKYQTTSERYILNPVIGEFDDPARQRQSVLRLPLSEEGNVIVYGAAGCGKTSFLNAAAYSLIEEHTPDEVNLYLLDFSSETLRAFASAPHVGEVILSYEAEKVSNLFKMLKAETEKRKKLFADYGGDFSSYIEASGNKLPSIVIMINNYAAFAETYEEKEDAISYLSREGTKYGIYFILTALGTSDVRFKMMQNFKQLFVLQLNDESDYSSVVGKTEGLYPAKYKGRGLVRKDELYEFQIASLVDASTPYSFIVNFCNQVNASWHGERARRIPILPEKVDADFLKDYIPDPASALVPIGVEKGSLNVHTYSFEQNYIDLVLSRNEERGYFLSALAEFIDGNYTFGGYYIDLTQTAETSLKRLNSVTNLVAAEKAAAELYNLVLYRNNTYKDAMASGTECEAFDKVIVIINAVSQLKSTLSEEGAKKLALVLEKGRSVYNVFVIIGEDPKSISGVTYDRWFKDQIAQSEGIWIGSGITEQYQMKPDKTTNDLHDELTADFGYVLRKGKPTRIKFLNNRPEDAENEQ